MWLLLCVEVDLDVSSANHLALNGGDGGLSVFARSKVDEAVARVSAIEGIYRDVHILSVPAYRQSLYHKLVANGRTHSEMLLSANKVSISACWAT